MVFLAQAIVENVIKNSALPFEHLSICDQSEEEQAALVVF